MAERRKYKRNPESWGAIRKLPSGRHQATYVGPDGIRYPARTAAGGPLTFDTVTDARAWLTETRRLIQRGEWESPTARVERLANEEKNAAASVFGKYAATWLDQRVSSKGQPLRPKTRHEYERQLRVGLAEFAGDRIAAITPARVRAWHAARMKHGKTQAGAEARLLRAILNTAVVDGIITTNPVPANLTRTSSGVKHRPPTPAEMAVLIDAMPEDLRLAMYLAAFGNLRLSEWRALRRRDLERVETDVTLDDGTTGAVTRYTVNVARQAQYITGYGWDVGEPKSEEGVRVTPLPAWMTEEVDAHLERHVGPFPDDLVFAPVGRSDFIHDRYFNDRWNVAREAAGLRYRTDDGTDGTAPEWVNVTREHDLRGHALTVFRQVGGTGAEAQKFGGHGTSQAAERYQHVIGDRIAEIVDRMPMPTRGTPKVAQIGRKLNGSV